MIERFFTTAITVERKTGHGAAGAVYAQPDTSLLGQVKASRKMVRDQSGREVISEARVNLPISTPVIAPGSKVTLPPEHSSRTAFVIADQRHDSGIASLPAYYAIDLT